MSDNNSMLNLSRKSRLTAEVTFLMLKGAGYAAALFFGLWILLAVIGWFGSNVLPEASQNAPDPAPQAFIDFAAREAASAMVMEPAASEELAPADGAATE